MKRLTPIFCHLALGRLSELPSAERADALDYAASLLIRDGFADQGTAAASAAKDIRNADAAQTHFEALLSAAIDQNKVQ